MEYPGKTDNPNLYCGKYMTHAVMNYITERSGYLIEKITKMLEGSGTYIDPNGFAEANYDNFYETLSRHNLQSVLWPAFYYTYHWAPSGIEKAGEPYIGKNCWYIPSAQEYTYLILNRIRQTANTTTQTAELNWNSNTQENFYANSGELKALYDKNVFFKLLTNLGATTSSVFESSVAIAFLKDRFNVLKSSTFSNSVNSTGSDFNNNVYTYYNSNNYNTEKLPSWKTSGNQDSVGYPYIGNKATVYPCCRIIKTVSSL